MGLPRSRTAWLANWFTTDRSLCLHDAWRYAQTAEELKAYLLSKAPKGCEYLGTADSGNGARFDELEDTFPAAPFALIERPLNDAIEATSKLAIVAPKSELVTRLAELNLQHHYLPGGVHRTRYKDLSDQLEMARLHKHLTPTIPFSFARYALLDQLRVQVHEEKYLLELTKGKAGY